MTRDSFIVSAATSQRHSLRPVPFTQVTIDDTFWSPRIAMNRTQTLPHAYRLLQETGHLAAFRLEWQPGDEPIPHIFWDSDVGKWLEAASYSLATHPDDKLARQVDDVIALIASAQQPDGYLNPHFTVVEPERRWQNLRDWHELYCAGHLIEAAVAHVQATGKHTLLDVMCGYADYIAATFGAGPDQVHGYDGHEEIELALVKLYAMTEEPRYLQLATYFVNERGRQPHFFDQEALARGEDPANFEHKTYEYNQTHLPVREQTQVVGHAVRAMYLYAAMADLARETGDDTLLTACQTLWEHLVSTRMYVTGGIGTSRHNEGFTTDYDLPNETAYAETCAAIGLVMWAHRMLQLDCDGRYADVLERALYNGVISGVSHDGTRFFYENPLASHGTHHRQRWYDVSCCPTNIARLLPSLGQYIYATSADEIAVHLYIQSEARLRVGVQAITLRQHTNYPWDGTIRLALQLETPAHFRLKLRIPGWCHQAAITVNGEPLPRDQQIERGYMSIARQWQDGDQVQLDVAMPIEHVYAHPAIPFAMGQVALQRGPLLYCVESADNDIPLHRLTLAASDVLQSAYAPSVLGGIVVIAGTAMLVADDEWQGSLYQTQPPHSLPHAITAIPYYAWDNRAAGSMRVWLHQRSTP